MWYLLVTWVSLPFSIYSLYTWCMIVIVVKLDEYKSPKYQEGKLGKQNNMVNEEITIGTM